jgi:hypothetical protein
MFFIYNSKNCIPYLNFDVETKQKITTLNVKTAFYFNVIDDDTITYNSCSSYYRMYFHNKTFMHNIKKDQRKNILNNKNTISHNFTIIENAKTDKEINHFAVGGCGKTNMYKSIKDFRSGIYLLKSQDMKNWNLANKSRPVIIAKETKGWNKLGNSQFDSNISCLYSSLLKKYVLFTRYNVGIGERGIQVFMSKDMKKWDKGRLCKIDTWGKKHNYYMNKIIEVPELKLFLAIMPFTNLSKNRTPSGIKLLISFDALNWKDCGLLFPVKGAVKHSSTPVIQPVGINIKEDKTMDVWFHDNYFSTEPKNIFKYTVDLSKLIGSKTNDDKEVTFEQKIKLESHQIKIQWDKCKDDGFVSLVHDNRCYKLNDLNIFKIDKSLELNKEYKFKFILKNATVYTGSFVS